ncbi:hypothetical protein V3W47_12185 [Deinococcus sp. YIM 134068]|uniref:hypothetical protein n=1 Tax=Deinococcus lichenicola TaxID=3118910 RepID=UPI002F92004C
MIVVQVFGPGGLIGVYGFQSVPHVHEEIEIIRAGVFRVTRVTHFAGDPMDGHPAAMTRIYVTPQGG